MRPSLASGLSQDSRRRLTILARQAAGPFSVSQAADLLGLELPRARRLLAHLASQGWLTRIRPNLYTTVPLDATDPAEWREDPWVVAARTFEPGYIGGWSAAEHHGLTEQLFRDVVVLTAYPARERHPVIQGTPYRVKVVAEEKLFGMTVVWRGRVRIAVSDPTRTIIDILDDPSLGGGIRHVAEIVETYFAESFRDDRRLLEYAERLGNKTVYKRLGYLMEVLSIDAPELVAACLERLSSGFSLLDPSLPPAGRFTRRWNLRLNGTIVPGSRDT
jgi:predicted transcriptional regulator of viral defense system